MDMIHLEACISVGAGLTLEKCVGVRCWVPGENILFLLCT